MLHDLAALPSGPAPRAAMARERRPDAFDVFATLLPGVDPGATPAGSDAELALRLDLDRPTLTLLRKTGLLAARKVGRAWIHDGRAVRRASVAVVLLRMGVEITDLVALTVDDGTPPATRCADVMERLAARLLDEIARRTTFERLIAEHRAEALRAIG